MSEESPVQIIGSAPKVSSTWRSIISSFKLSNQVHPLEPVSAKDSEFICIDSKIKLRVTHVIPEKSRRSLIINQDIPSKRSSLSEEYWFTRNQPLRTGCNCSFRRSSRYSFTLNQPLAQINSKRQSLVGVDLPPVKIRNLETFVERLVQETFFEAFQEYFMKHTDCGIDNLAYDATEDEPLVTFRKKNKLNSKQWSSDTSNKHFQRINLNDSNKNCVHKKKTMKPLIIFIHGLGASADVWKVMMQNFSFKGFETVAPDMLGHGFSSAPTKAGLYTFKNLLFHALTVFDYFMEKEEKRKCILIGHSYGCSLITALYPHRATKIAQLILISGGGPTPLAPPADVNEISPYGCVHNLFYPFLYCGLKRSFFYSSRGKHFNSCERETTVPPHVLEFLINGQYWPEGDAAFHRRIMVPTLLVHGLQDKNVTLVQECEMERTIPRAFLELLPNAGHMSIVEIPEHLTHMILCFIEMWS